MREGGERGEREKREGWYDKLQLVSIKCNNQFSTRCENNGNCFIIKVLTLNILFL